MPAFVDEPDAVEHALAGLIEQAQASGLADPDADARMEAISLLAMTATMGTSILVGQRTPDSALAVLRHHLNRIFTMAEPPARGAGSP
ncbi:hypothetical protein [Streptomyces sp. NPDC057695]|uniref:hypothetical protein n=1 Tax=Streptomyces sp. NPDC057695 TaxID=3346217 RepID=UPI0036C4F076